MPRGKTKIENPFDLMMQEARSVSPSEPMSPAAKATIGILLFLGGLIWGMSEFMQYMDRVYP